MARIKVRARTLDMLGRQQMASIPNALHELYKNAYDAYADLARTDYYREEKVLMLRDDGIGMTHEDFENRWLTLGTESKMNQGGLEPPYTDKAKTYRYPLGEKGIGRLAIAAVGPQVFILSRAEREQCLQEMVVSFVNWTFFEIPGLNIDVVTIPLMTVPVGAFPAESDLAGLVTEVERNFAAIKDSVPNAYADKIACELSTARANLPAMYNRIASMPLATGRGTAFIITPADTVLEQDIDEDVDDIAPPLLRNLRGFTNTMMPDSDIPLMTAEFWDHRRDGSTDDIIGREFFFTPEEFLSADQHIEGEFDEYGQFTGNVSIYHQAPQKYLLPWTGAQGKKTLCGKFKIKFGYLQGLLAESLLPDEEWRPLAEKLNRSGGIYVYRNGIRVLPYGNSDVDWLNIERRRTKAAKDWIFSYRRVFGAVELSSPENSALVEKAGREGFRENLAYRQFRTVLEHLFKEVARDWFRENTAKHGNYRELLSGRQETAALLKKRAASIKGKQEKLKNDLDIFFDKYEQRIPQATVDSCRMTMQSALQRIRGLSPDDASKELLELEGEMLSAVQKLRTEYRVVSPRGVTIFKNTRKELDRSAELFISLEEEYFYPFEQEINTNITRAITETKALLSHRKRIKQALSTRSAAEEKRAKTTVKEAKDGVETLQQEVIFRTREGLSTLDLVIKNAFIALEREDLSAMNEEDIESLRKKLDINLEDAAQVQIQDLERLNNQIHATLEAIQSDIPLDETAAALEERSQALEEELSRYTELAQVGAAIGILRHEFESTATGLRNQLRQLMSKTSGNDEVFQLSQNIRASFEHLDTYLRMFTPFNRRIYRKPQNITGNIVIDYLKQLFAERFERHQIELQISPAFKNHSVLAYPSAFFPAFINIVDNALYWLTRDAAGEKILKIGPRVVTFDADDDGFLVGNNGPGIEARDSNRIFEMSFTRKIHGRGMGLAVAQKALKEAGFGLSLEKSGRDISPVFRLHTR
jgi:Signal transduction histidine kinase